MKFKILVRHLGDDLKDAWWEEYDKEYIVSKERLDEWARGTIEMFNDTLKPGESPREYLDGVLLPYEDEDDEQEDLYLALLDKYRLSDDDVDFINRMRPEDY